MLSIPRPTWSYRHSGLLCSMMPALLILAVLKAEAKPTSIIHNLRAISNDQFKRANLKFLIRSKRSLQTWSAFSRKFEIVFCLSATPCLSLSRDLLLLSSASRNRRVVSRLGMSGRKDSSASEKERSRDGSLTPSKLFLSLGLLDRFLAP